MRRSAGFTLIELVIVIVILGILGAVAAPKFLNLTGDAYGANVKSLAGSLQSAATLAHTKAVLEGKDKVDVAGTEGDIVTGYDKVAFLNGFPIAAVDETGILGALQSVPVNDVDYAIQVSSTVPLELVLQPKSRAGENATAILAATKCFVKYTAATSDVAAKINFDADCE